MNTPVGMPTTASRGSTRNLMSTARSPVPLRLEKNTVPPTRTAQNGTWREAVSQSGGSGSCGPRWPVAPSTMPPTMLLTTNARNQVIRASRTPGAVTVSSAMPACDSDCDGDGAHSAIVECPALGRPQPLGVTSAHVVGVRVALGAQRIDPRRLRAVVVCDRRHRWFSTCRPAALASHRGDDSSLGGLHRGRCARRRPCGRCARRRPCGRLGP